MKPVILSLCFILIIYPLKESKLQEMNGSYYNDIRYPGIQFLQEIDFQEQNNLGKEKELSPMEALDLVKEKYATNFIKVFLDSPDEYYYKLTIADYYLVYEGMGETEKEYLVHLYEFVVDEPAEGIGHTVTYGWYTVDGLTGVITQQ